MRPLYIASVTLDTNKVLSFNAVEDTGDPNLLDGYEYIGGSETYITGTPPMLPTDHNWKITGDGFGQLQLKKTFDVGGAIACQVGPNSAQSKMCVKYVRDSLGNFNSLEAAFDASNVFGVTGSKITAGNTGDFAVQPVEGDFAVVLRVSMTEFSVLIIAADKTTIKHSEDYTVADTNVVDSGAEFDTAGGASIGYKLQFKDLTTVA